MRAYSSRNFHRSFVFRRFARYSAPWGRTSLTASLPMLVAESGGPTMFARIGVMRALNRNVEACLVQIGRITPGDAGN